MNRETEQSPDPIRPDEKKPYREVVQRYCPLVRDTVVMLVQNAGDDRIFECVKQDTCQHCGGKVCRRAN